VTVPAGDAVLDSEWLGDALRGSPRWPHGSLRVTSATQIGLRHGLSGRIHRVLAETERGGSRSFVVKQETAGAVERELLFRSECGALLRGWIPELLGGARDARADRGVLLLEDVAPAEQGDVLHGCTDEQAEAVVRVLAGLHAGSLNVSDAALSANVPRWTAKPMDPERWSDRVQRSSERFPEILTPSLTTRLHDLPRRVGVAGRKLGQGPASWIHVDAHLDNVLFRPDGTPVLLDWCNAAIGPPAVDLVRFLSEGVVAASKPSRVTMLLSAYAEELGESEAARVVLSELESDLGLALLPLLQGAVGWAGREDLELHGRSAALCETFLRSVCDWVLAEDSASQGGRRTL
jgi:thiamine kinase-like enzyme